MFNEFSKLVLDRQSCRNFNDKPLDKETIDKIVTLALNTPSACNSQPWKMYVVTEENMRREVASAVQDTFMNKFVDKAQAFIVVADTDAKLAPGASLKFAKNHFVKYDVGELVAYLTLGAESLGVSSCIIGWVNQKKLQTVIPFGENEISNIVIALGYSDIEKRKKSRKDKAEKVVYL